MKVTFVDLRIHYKRIKSEIDETIGGVIAAGAFIGGKYVRKFEEEFAVFTGSKHIIGVGNGTDALILALRSLNFETGFEVIVPANSFIATAEAVTYAGGRIVFCDVDSKTFLTDLTHAETLVTSRTCAIIPVHLYGQMMDMKKVRYFADRHGLVIIEDAAQAHGA